MATDLTEKLDKATKEAQQGATPRLTVPAPGYSDRVAVAISAPPTLGQPGNRSEPLGTLTSPAATGLSPDRFSPSTPAIGSGLTGQAQAAQGISYVTGSEPGKPPAAPALPGRDANGVITAESAQSVAGAPMERSGGVFGAIDMKGANAVLHRENDVRQSMIDKETKPSWQAQFGNRDPEKERIAESNALLDKWDRQYQAQNAVQTISGMNPRVAGSAAQVITSGQHADTAARGQDLSHAAAMAAQGITIRGQDMNAQSDAQRNQVAMRGQDIGAQSAGIRAAGDPLDNAAKRLKLQSEGQMAGLQAQYLAEQDPKRREELASMIRGVTGKWESAPAWQFHETERGAMAFNPKTLRMEPVAGPDGQPVASTKPLTEFQGKSTSFGLRADAASKIIDQVGQGGKVQPSLIKRAAEAVPLIGEGLGMAANALQSPEQQQVEQAQRDFVNAVLRQESGAAISSSEFDNARKQYFAQPNDSAEVVAQKQANREMAINGFRISAGPGAKNIGTAPAQPQQTAAPAIKVGTVDSGHVYIGGDPGNPASWKAVQ